MQLGITAPGTWGCAGKEQSCEEGWRLARVGSLKEPGALAKGVCAKGLSQERVNGVGQAARKRLGKPQEPAWERAQGVHLLLQRGPESQVLLCLQGT